MKKRPTIFAVICALIGSSIALGVVAASSAYGQSMEISPNGSRKSLIGSDKNFTGIAIVDPLYGANQHLP